MPIYEYQAIDPEKACAQCRERFEVIQKVSEKPLSTCMHCGNKVEKVISMCRAAVMEYSEKSRQVESKIKSSEKSGMWSHAAELADKHATQTKDKDMKVRALDNYKQAGYSTETLSKQAKSED